MSESYIKAAKDAGPEGFIPILKDGMQHFSDGFSAVIRSADPRDYALVVVAMEQCAAALRATLPEGEFLRLAILSTMFTPIAISRKWEAKP